MASKYWIKLYHEILDDPKMGRMPDRLWRRTIELFLLAGELDQDGALPELRDIAWRIRIPDDQLADDMSLLTTYQIVHQQDGCYIVTKFADRQAAMTSTERTRRYRETKKHDEYEQVHYGKCDDSGTNRYTDIDTDKDIDTDTDTDKKYAPAGISDQEADFIDLFFDITGIERMIGTGTYANWVQQVGEWVDMKVTEEEVKRAYEIAQKKNLTIIRPGGLTGVIRIERSNPRTAQPVDNLALLERMHENGEL